MKLNCLPRDIQIYISEYNVEHRPKMKLVLNELLRYYYCGFCQEILENNDREKYSNHLYGKEYHFCSSYCLLEAEYYARRR